MDLGINTRGFLNRVTESSLSSETEISGSVYQRHPQTPTVPHLCTNMHQAEGWAELHFAQSQDAELKFYIFLLVSAELEFICKA